MIRRRPISASDLPRADGGSAPASSPVHSSDLRIGVLRVASIATVIVATWAWHARTTGSPSWQAFAFLAAFVVVCAAFGMACARATRTLFTSPGMAYELLVGFLAFNTLLFALMLAAPLGIGGNIALLTVLAAVFAIPRPVRAGIAGLAGGSLRAESGSLACIVFSALAATLWVGDQQPLTTTAGDLAVFNVWTDVFLHSREISAFAQSHGLSSLLDIKLAGVPAAAYHFASYMVPAALNALTRTTAMDAYASFQLPFGILLVGMAAYTVVAVTLRTTWPAVIAAAAVIALPDAYQQGFGIRYLSYHFMSQVNLGMLYGIACMAVSWMFMIEGCRRDRVLAVVVAYSLLAACVAYKAHLFVANALILMLYPCLFFASHDRRIRTWWRVVAALLLCALFVTVVSLSQLSPRVPTFRVDPSDAAAYIAILLGGFSEGPLRQAFEWLYYQQHLPFFANFVLAVSLVTFASFGFWIVAMPYVYWKTRRTIGRPVWAFVFLVVTNYVLMSVTLALDRRGIGAPEELLNRPHAWAYFVVTVFVAGGAAVALRSRRAFIPRRAGYVAVPAAVLLLLFVFVAAKRLQTFPEWGGRDDYVQFNAVPACLVRAARYVRDHGQVEDELLDSRFDPQLATSALAERQAYVARSNFGGNAAVVEARVSDVERIQTTVDAKALIELARANHIRWYVLHPADSVGWDPQFLDRAVYRCGQFRVFRFDD